MARQDDTSERQDAARHVTDGSMKEVNGRRYIVRLDRRMHQQLRKGGTTSIAGAKGVILGSTSTSNAMI